jgi:TolB-like protein/Tfp pilus assembly protein PilF
MTAVAVGLLGSTGSDRRRPQSASDAPAPGSSRNVAAADMSWTPPRVPGATADQPWLSAQGMYAIMVLPVGVEPDQPDDKRLADRLFVDLVNDLSRVPALRVISRNTAELYRGHPVDAAAVGVELGVRYLVELDLHRDDRDRVTLNIALTDTASRLQVWSDRFTHPVSDEPELRDDLSRSIARRLQINVVLFEESRSPPRRDQADAGPAELVAKGWGAMLRMSRADKADSAKTYFEAALERDPDSVPALTGLGAYYVQSATMFLRPGQAPELDRAEQMLQRAVTLDRYASLPHFYLGMLAKLRGAPDAALAAFAKVIALNPSYAPAYAQIGHLLSRTGHLDEALEHVRYAIRLSPKDHNLGIWSLFGGEIELELGHDAAALEWLSRAAELTPRSPFAQAALAAAYALHGDRPNAGRRVAIVRALAPWLTNAEMARRLAGLSEGGNEPRRLLEGLRLAFGAPS